MPVPRAAGLTLSEAAAELGAFRVADEDYVGAGLLEQVERLPVLGLDDLEPVLGQVPLEEAPRRLLRLGEE